MADKDDPLSLVSQEELDARLDSNKPEADQQASTYQGPDRRSGTDRRKGLRDRREMLRFEPEKDRADRRSGRDRRATNNKADDLWKQRDI